MEFAFIALGEAAGFSLRWTERCIASRSVASSPMFTPEYRRKAALTVARLLGLGYVGIEPTHVKSVTEALPSRVTVRNISGTST